MKSKTVVFKSPNVVVVEDREVGGDTLEPNQFLLRSEASVISQGTELACLSGKEWWFTLPRAPGYGNIGRVLSVGSAVKDLKVGDLLFSYCGHAKYHVADVGGFYLKVPEGLDPTQAVMARMIQVAFSGVRLSGAELGDWVAVQGLGLVGNFAAQLLAAAGAKVIGLDVSPKRLQTARDCGIANIIDSSKCDPVTQVKELTGGAMCEAVIEATGVPSLAATAVNLTAQNGCVVLAGTPRGAFTADATEMLRDVHHAHRNVHIKGGHEWILPTRPTPFVKHSIERNIHIAWDLMKNGQLRTKEVTSHIVSPLESPDVYRNLVNRDDRYFGVVFDWTLVD